MKHKPILYSLLFIAINMSCHTTYHLNMPTHQEMLKWADEKQWANGLVLNLHSSVNRDSFYVAYHRNKKLWDSAFAFLKNQQLENLPAGKYPIIGEQVFASVSEAPSHKKEEVQWESHRKYIDLQYIIRGRELIGIADISKASITKPYTGDAVNYTAEGDYYVASQSEFFLFFPNDAHRPTIKVDGYDVVKKIVIKILVAKAE
jgi:biofilm protein TabA